MKFLSLINRNYLLTISILLVTTSFVAFYILQKTLTEETKEDLLENEQAIINEIKTRNNLPNIYPTIETDSVSVSNDGIIKKYFKEVMIKDRFDDGEEEPFLEYRNIVSIYGKLYKITIRKSLFEYEELLLTISIPLFSLLFFAFLFSLLINRRLNKTVWKDFEFNLGILKKYSFKDAEGIKLKKTNIQEFDELNKLITELTSKLHSDYQALKDFTENASHEIQTPISIISVNLEEILQDNIPEQTFQLIVNTQQSLKRLSDLNNNLLLLTKIENRQFLAKEELDFNKIVKNKVDELSPLIKTKSIKVDVKENGIFRVKINKELADILLNNLLANAVKHNWINGNIDVELSENELKISNTGESNKLTNETIFNRFTKEKSQSYGLGLAIVKQICDTHTIGIDYLKSDVHCFVLSNRLEL
jgi:signal transduction histidine kinase